MDRKVLLIGNHQSAWNSLVQGMEGWVSQAIKATVCTEGMRILLQDREIDLVIVQSEATNDCGLKFLRTLRGNSRLTNIPVMVAGISFDEQTVVQFQELAVYDIILLPIDNDTLEAKIERAFLDTRPTILVVDDEPVIAELVSNFVEMERMRAIAVNRGEDALKELAKAPNGIHAVVTDIMMPGMSGLDLLVQVKTEYPHVPVILITGHAGQYTPKAAIESGADGYFSKPFHNVELMYTLRRVLGQYHPRLSSRGRGVGAEAASR